MARNTDEIDAKDVSVRDMSAEEIDAMLGDLSMSTAEFEQTPDQPAAEPPAQGESAADSAAGESVTTPESGAETTAHDSEAAPSSSEVIDEVLARATQAMQALEHAVGADEVEGGEDVDSDAPDGGAGTAGPQAARPPADTDTAGAADMPAAEVPEAAARTEEDSPAAAAPAGIEDALHDPQQQGAAGQEDAEALSVSDPEPPQPVPSRALGMVRVGRALAGLAVRGVVILDRPFAGMSPSRKAVFGYAAIATLVVAVATWIAGSFIRPA